MMIRFGPSNTLWVTSLPFGNVAFLSNIMYWKISVIEAIIDVIILYCYFVHVRCVLSALTS